MLILTIFLVFSLNQEKDEVVVENLYPTNVAVPIKNATDSAIEFSDGSKMYPQSIDPQYGTVIPKSPEPYLDSSDWEDKKNPTTTEFMDSWWEAACENDQTIEGCEDYL